ncbi:MAG: Crp/Fnr family transcriptional regulator [Pseudomonadota bacterium]
MPKPMELEAARQSILLANLPEDLVATILAHATVQCFDRGATIFLQSDPARFVYIVLEGWVKLLRISASGAEAVVGVFTRGRSFGEAAAFRSDVYPVTAEAVTECRLLQVRAATILETMQLRPELGIAMLASTFRHLHALVAQVEQLKAHTGAQRVAEFLLDLCPVEEGACAVTLPYDKTLIAGRLGMKPESLSRAFSRLREAGVVIKQSRAAIADVGALRDYVEEDKGTSWRRAQ